LEGGQKDHRAAACIVPSPFILWVKSFTEMSRGDGGRASEKGSRDRVRNRTATQAKNC
jgi:hypothetical protein